MRSVPIGDRTYYLFVKEGGKGSWGGREMSVTVRDAEDLARSSTLRMNARVYSRVSSLGEPALVRYVLDKGRSGR